LNILSGSCLYFEADDDSRDDHGDNDDDDDTIEHGDPNCTIMLTSRIWYISGLIGDRDTDEPDSGFLVKFQSLLVTIGF
jgi:hypothetical protein